MKIKPTQALKAAIHAISLMPYFKVKCDIPNINNSYDLLSVLDQVLAEMEME